MIKNKLILTLEEKEEKKDLLLYYKDVLRCSKCSRLYGITLKNDTGFCPLCEINIKLDKRKENKEKKIQTILTTK